MQKLRVVQHQKTVEERRILPAYLGIPALEDLIQKCRGDRADLLADAVSFMHLAFQGDVTAVKIVASDPPFLPGRGSVLVLPHEPVVIGVKIQTAHPVTPVRPAVGIRHQKSGQPHLQFSQLSGGTYILVLIAKAIRAGIREGTEHLQ